jgi:hypothetical protein
LPLKGGTWGKIGADWIGWVVCETMLFSLGKLIFLASGINSETLSKPVFELRLKLLNLLKFSAKNNFYKREGRLEARPTEKTMPMMVEQASCL